MKLRYLVVFFFNVKLTLFCCIIFVRAVLVQWFSDWNIFTGAEFESWHGRKNIRGWSSSLIRVG